MNKNKTNHLLSLALIFGLSACGNEGKVPPVVEQPQPQQPAPTLIAFDTDGVLSANIRRTSFGVPHITGDNLKSVGFGSGYAYAQDNICILADQMVKIRSERSKYFGPDKVPGSGDSGNIISDFGHHALKVLSSATTLYPSLSDNSRALIEGYASGYNKYLAETGVDNLAPQCAGQAWVKPISAIELTAYMFATSQYASGARFLDTAFLANPGDAAEYLPYIGQKADASRTNSISKNISQVGANIQSPDLDLGDWGSNGWGIGKDKTENGKGIVLANPHFPHTGHLRFWQSHVTIPGVMDVMGGSLQGFPVQNIGYNQNVAWTHTVSASRRFVVYQLSLANGNRQQYVVDGETKDIEKKTFYVEVNAGGGQSVILSKDFFYSHHGLIIETPAALNFMSWTDNHAFTLRDSAEENIDMVDHWLAMNLATDIDEFQQAIKDYDGIPWVNTMYSDDQGNAFYIDKSRIFNFNDTVQNLLATDPVIVGTRKAVGFDILPGNMSLFEPDGLNSYEQAPKLLNGSYVQNSNDTYWFTNPDETLSGYSALYGDSNTQLSLRTRMGLKMLTDTAGSDDKFSVSEVESALLSNRAYLAELVLPELLTQCKAQAKTPVMLSNGDAVDISEGCTVLSNWDKLFNLDSSGAHLFREFAYKFNQSTQLTVGFDVTDAAMTPNTLTTDGSALVSLAGAIKNIDASGFALNATIADIQFTEKTMADGSASGMKFPWAGSKGTEGGFNVFSSAKSDDTLYSIHQYTPVKDVETNRDLRSGLTQEGYHINYGSSWMFVVGFTDEGPSARGLLSYSQSSNNDSPHSDDQNKLYSETSGMRPFFFTEADINTNTISEMDITLE
jgi:acyl-homoserine-lactone acylase